MAATDFVFEAGNLALDLLNTRPVSGGVRQEYLPSPEALSAWLGAAGLRAPGAGAPALTATRRRRLLRDAHALRDAIETLVARPGAGRAARAAVATVNRILAASPTVTALRWDSQRLARERVSGTAGDAALLAPVATAAVELLTEADPARIRRCDDESCVLWFLDTSRNGRRRWCSMARCGNRAKVAAHYRRTSRTRG